MAKTNGEELHVGVLLGDPRLPHTFSQDEWFVEGERESARRLKEALAQLDGYRFTYFEDHDRLVEDLRAAELDLALNFCEGGYRNDWMLVSHVPSLLELLGVPFTGSQGSAIDTSANKAVVRALAMNLAVPVPNEMFVDLTARPLQLPRTYPALIKPNAAGGSFGVTTDCVVHDAAQARKHLRWLAGQVQPPEALIQDFLTGRELTIGLIGNPGTGFAVLPPAEVDYSQLDPDLSPVFAFNAKFDPESRYWKQLRHVQAELDDVTYARLVDGATRLFQRLGLRDYARFDFRCGSDGHPRLLDANPNPTWHWDARLAMSAQWGGYDYPAMLRLILQAAEARYGLRG